MCQLCHSREAVISAGLPGAPVRLCEVCFPIITGLHVSVSPVPDLLAVLAPGESADVPLPVLNLN